MFFLMSYIPSDNYLIDTYSRGKVSSRPKAVFLIDTALMLNLLFNQAEDLPFNICITYDIESRGVVRRTI